MKDAIEQRLGYWVSRARLGAVCEAACALATQRGFSDMGEYMDMVRELPVTAPLMQSLIHTVARRQGTFFQSRFGDASLMTAVLPELRRLCDERATLRVWVPECGSGERCYTMAALLCDLVPEAWTISVLGTDVDDRQLRKARRARFGDWTAQRLPAPTVQACFRLDRQSKTLEVRRHLKDLVDFAFHHLADPESPDLPTRFDLIDGRGLGARLTDHAIEQAWKTFRRSLAPDGLLLLDPADPMPGPDWQRMGHPDLVVFRLAADKRLDSRKPQSRLGTTFSPVARNADAIAMAEQMLDDAQRLAAVGSLPSALHLAHEAILTAPEWADAYVTLARLLVEAGEEPLAIVELQRAVHLDTSLAHAHLELARLQARHGAEGDAVRAYRSAIALVAALELPSPEDTAIRSQACMEVIALL